MATNEIVQVLQAARELAWPWPIPLWLWLVASSRPGRAVVWDVIYRTQGMPKAKRQALVDAFGRADVAASRPRRDPPPTAVSAVPPPSLDPPDDGSPAPPALRSAG